jgi:hypothetical protein
MFSILILSSNVAFVIADPFYKNIWAGVPPFNVRYQICCKKNIYVNDSQNLAFPTSHFVIELLPFDYLSNQKQEIRGPKMSKRVFYVFVYMWSIYFLTNIDGRFSLCTLRNAHYLVC